MFHDVMSSLSQAKDAFSEQVRDAFGRSIDLEVFEPVFSQLQRLEAAHEEAELKKAEIQMLTLELRIIL